MDELKPCPFCGGEVYLVFFDTDENVEKAFEECDEDEGAVFPYISCNECDGNFVFAGLSYSRQVIEAWNRRLKE